MIDLRLPRRLIFVILIALGLIVSLVLNAGFVVQAASTTKDPVIMAAGDIACDPQSSNFNGGKGKNGNCQMMATSDVVIKVKPNAVLALGDNQYEKGELANFQASYHPTWGRFKSITRPVPGNHEYYGSNAEGYYQYFGKAAGDRDKGYYSFNLGNWHLIALNSNCEAIGGCEVGSPQEKWLKADLKKIRKLAPWPTGIIPAFLLELTEIIKSLKTFGKICTTRGPN
ncbi:MAG: metallophosphoesterase family protein [Snowella sp.]